MPDNSEFELESTRRKLETSDRQIAELKGELKAANARIARAEAREAMTIAAAEAGMPPQTIVDVVNRVSSASGTWKRQAGTYVLEADDGCPAINSRGVEMTIQDAIADLRTSAPHLHQGAQEAPQPPSSGTKAPTKHSGINPWKTGAAWNMTQQAAIYRENPDLALALATEAGKPVFKGGKVGEMPASSDMRGPIRGY
jgi:hypothetical protein